VEKSNLGALEDVSFKRNTPYKSAFYCLLTVTELSLPLQVLGDWQWQVTPCFPMRRHYVRLWTYMPALCFSFCLLTRNYVLRVYVGSLLLDARHQLYCWAVVFSKLDVMLLWMDRNMTISFCTILCVSVGLPAVFELTGWLSSFSVTYIVLFIELYDSS